MAGRGNDLDELTRSFNDCQTGKGCIRYITGPAGTGKTTTLSACAEYARANGGDVHLLTVSRAERETPLATLNRIRDHLLGGQEGNDDGDGPPPLLDMIRYCHQALLTRADASPVFLGLDDAQNLDRTAWAFLSYCAQRIGGARVYLAVSSLDQPYGRHPAPGRELRALPHFRHVPLSPLSPADASELLSAHGKLREYGLVAEYLDAVGGNPALLLALADNSPGTMHPDPGGYQSRDTFAEAVVAVLDRYDPEVLSVAECVAVLGDAASERIIGQVTGIDIRSVRQVVQTLSDSGIFSGMRFRHPRAQGAVLDHMTSAKRQEMYLQAAMIMHYEGADEIEIAKLLLTAGKATHSWALSALENAADKATSAGELRAAVDYLKLASLSCADDARRAMLTFKLARAERLLNPQIPGRLYPELIQGIRVGHICVQDAISIIEWLTWNDNFIDAMRALKYAKNQAAQTGQSEMAEFMEDCRRLGVFFPQLSTQLEPVSSDHSDILQATTPVLRSAKAISTVVIDGRDEEAVRSARAVLSDARLAPETLEAIRMAVTTLAISGESDEARHVIDTIRPSESVQASATCRAILADLRGQVALRQGIMPEAEREALYAIRLIGMDGWGVAAAGPLATLVSAQVAMGRLENARRWLGEPLPATTFRTRYGLHYLFARGLYKLAVRQSRSAMDDFLACGALMKAWGVDNPALIPWRIGAGEGYLQLGEPQQARAIAVEQLRMHGDRHGLSHGTALRTKAAATVDRYERSVMLREAVAMVERSGNRYEHIRTLFELAQACRITGDHQTARTTARQVRRLAAAIEAEPLLRAARELYRGGLVPLPADESPCDFPMPDSPKTHLKLSQAEKRVAEAAAQGLTNREIAAKLNVTVSTVEQHLTRAYRKLQVTRRNQLPLTIG